MKINIPTQLSEIKLHQYQQYVKVLEHNPTVTQFLKHKAIEIFCSVPLAVVARFPKKEIDAVYELLTKLLDTDATAFQQRFKFAGKEFGFIPDFENMTSGEYMDLSQYITSWDTMEKAMAVLFRPVTATRGTQYLIEDYQGSQTLAGLMLDLPLDKALGAVFFLTNSFKQLSADTLQYLTEQAAENPELKAGLLKNGAGITQFTNALRGISSVLTR